MLVNDNEESRKMIESCYKRRKTLVNPIIDWTTEEVWEFIREYKIPYCKLYDEGYERLGCIGCPMGSIEHRMHDLNRYPTYRKAYVKSFEKMILNKTTTSWKTGEDVMNWWLRKAESDDSVPIG